MKQSDILIPCPSVVARQHLSSALPSVFNVLLSEHCELLQHYVPAL